MRAEIVLFSLLACTLIAADNDSDSGSIGGRGFGDDYSWKSFEAGIKEAESTGKPAMVVIHKSW
jgi:hypothetical protein